MKIERIEGFVNESLDFKSLLFEDWFGSEWIENAPSHQVGFVVKSWADNLIVNHIESRMNFILHLNQEIDRMDVSDEIRMKGFGTKIEKLEGIIKEKEITSAYDFLGALKLLRVLRNQCSHSYKRPEYIIQGLSLLGSHLFASEDYKPNHPLLEQKKEEIDIDEKYVLAINDSPAFGDNKLRGYKLSEQLGETDKSPFQFDFTSVGHIYNQIANIEKLAMLVDVYLFPLIAGEVKTVLPYSSCVWKYSFRHNCYIASKNYGKGVCLYLGTKEELISIMARKIKVFGNEVLRCSSDPCYLEEVAFQQGTTELAGTFICRED